MYITALAKPYASITAALTVMSLQCQLFVSLIKLKRISRFKKARPVQNDCL